MTPCPPTGELEKLLEGQVEGDEADALSCHVGDCPTCQSALEGLTGGGIHPKRDRDSVSASRTDFLERLKAIPVSLSGRLGARGRPSFLANGVLPSIPGYETLSELGRGGIGVVYLARQRSLNRLVALKVLRSGPHANAEERERFHHEAEAVARLRHPSIVNVYEVGEHENIPFLALEYVEGGSLKDRLHGDPQPLTVVVSLVERVARAIHHAHQAGLIHRDLKPANILIEKDEGGLVKITDFGLAKRLDDPSQRTASGDIVGTPSYMAPEQAGGGRGELGPATDVYALGTILYEMLTGRPPFKGATAVDTVIHLLHREPVPPGSLRPDLPRDLETICLTCLNKEPARRYRSALALAEDLTRFRRGQPILARPVGPLERAVKWARRHPLPASLLAGIVLVALIGFLGVTWQWRKALDARDKVLEEKRQKEIEREDAERARAEAAVQRGEARTALYGSRITQSQLSWRVNDLIGARRALESCSPAVSEKDQRGWEWYHLRRLYRSDLFTLDHGSGGGGGTVAHSPRGDTLASILSTPDRGGDGELVIWEARTGKRLLRHAVPAPMHRLAYSPDGLRLALAGTDGVVVILDAATGREERRWKAHDRDVTAVAYSPDGNSLLTCSWDGTARLWAARDGKAGPVFRGHAGRIQSACFHPNGKLLATAGWDGSVRLWPLGGGESRELKGHKAPVFGVAFSPDGKHLASGAQSGNVKIWEVESGRAVQTFTGLAGAVLELQFSPDGRYLAYGGGDGTARVWDFEAGNQEANFRGHSGPVEGVSFSPDAQTLVSCCPREGTLAAWDMTRNPETAIFARTGADVEALAFDPPGRKLMILTVDGRLQHLDRESGVLLAEHGLVPVPKPRRAVLAALSHSLVAVAAPSGGAVRLWDAGTGAAGQEFTVGGQVTCLAFSPKARQLAVGVLSKGGAFVTVRDPATGRELGWSPVPALPTALTFRDNQWLAWGTNRGQVGLTHWRSGRTVAMGPHKGAVLALAFSPDRSLFASAGEDDAAVFLSRVDLPAEGRASWSPAGQLEAPTGLCGLAFSPDGNRLAGCTRDVVKLWDPRGKLEMLTLRGSPQRYWDGPFSPRIAFSPDGAGLAGTNWDESVSLWEAEDASGEEPAETLRRRAWRLAEERAVYWHLQEAEQCLRFQNAGAAKFHLQRMGDAPLSPPLMARREAVRAKVAMSEE